MAASTHSFSFRFFLLNPVSGARIMLPPNSTLECSYETKAVASSVPTITRWQLPRPGCYVSCLHFEKEGGLAFCAPADKSWTFIEAKADLELGDIEIIDGKLYAVGRHPLEVLMLFDIQLDSSGGGLHTYTTEKIITLHPNVERIVKCRYFRFWSGVEYYYQCCYLAKGSESKDLFLILHKGDYIRGKTIGFQVLKLENNVSTGPQWVEIVDLGDQVLFMGETNNKFISSGSISHDQTLERNSVYFAFDWPKTCESGVFSLTNRSIKPLNIPNKEQLHTGLNRTLWFTPNPW